MMQNKEGLLMNNKTIYYVSSKNGADCNTGLSPEEAFGSLDSINHLALEAGDTILLERGSVFNNDYLHIDSSGEEGALITIASYGEGSKPVINTNGEGVFYQDYGIELDNPVHRYQGNVSASILLKDSSYIEIRDLELVNTADDGDKPRNDIDFISRTGIAVIAQNKGTVSNILIENMYIHDIQGNVYDKHMLNGGIYFICAVPENEETGIPRYDSVTIRNNFLNRVNRWGIALAYTAHHDQFLGAEISDETIKKYGHTNILIENNYLMNTGGDAITTMYCERPIVQYNMSDRAARHINEDIYSATSNGRVAAGVWPWKCKDAEFIGNEVFATAGGDNGNFDAQAFDIDSGDGTSYKYNYSHNNTGGAIMFCLQEAIRNTFTNNISQEDYNGIICVSKNPDGDIDSNVFIVSENTDLIRHNMHDGAGRLQNNVFYYTGDASKKENWYEHLGNLKYENNTYINYDNLPQDSEAKTSLGVNKISADIAKAASSITSSLANLNPLVGTGGEFTDQVESDDQIEYISLEISGRKVSKEEFSLAIYRTLYLERFLLEDTDVESANLLESSINTMEKIIALYKLAEANGILDSISAEDINGRRLAENNKRAIKLAKKEHIYGMKEFTYSTYYEYERYTLAAALQKILNLDASGLAEVIYKTAEQVDVTADTTELDNLINEFEFIY